MTAQEELDQLDAWDLEHVYYDPHIRVKTLIKLALEKAGITCDVKYQPPPESILPVPCIVYETGTPTNRFADNATYIRRMTWQITIKDSNVLSLLPKAFRDNLGMALLKQVYPSNNVMHWVYELNTKY